MIINHGLFNSGLLRRDAFGTNPEQPGDLWFAIFELNLLAI